MEIDHVSFSSSGGAGLVAKSLASTQTLLGHDSRLTSLFEENLHDRPFQNPALTIAAFADSQIVRTSSTKTMVSLFRSDFHLLDPEKLRSGALLNIHWNQGVIKSSSVLAMLTKGKSVVWTLHDMAPFTGVCHHNNGCVQFQTNCSDCPEVRRPFQRHVMSSLVEKALFEVPQARLCLVAPSKWMAKAALESRVFKHQRVEVIQNPINAAFFENHAKIPTRVKLGISNEALVGATLATRLDDPGKRVEELLAQFFRVAEKAGKPAKYLLFGSGGEKLAAKFPDVIAMGRLKVEEIPQFLVAADFVGTLSIAESAGMTVREAGALAVPSIAFSNLGAAEQINHMQDGVLLDEADGFGNYIQRIIEGRLDLVSLGVQAQQRSRGESKPEVAANKYLDLYSELA